MSAIGNIGSSSVGGAAAFQSKAPPRGRPPEPTAEMKAQFESKFESAAKELGVDASAFKELRSKIEEAVKNARGSASEGTDVKSAIDDAVDAVLEENGVDPAEFKSQMEAVFEKMGMPKPGQGGFGPQAQGDAGGSFMSRLPVGSFVDETI